jgi:type IV pilus assembly protein PilF
MKRIIPLTLSALIFFSSCASTEMSKDEKRGNVYHQAGIEALVNGQYTDALGSLLQAVRYLPKDPAAWTNLGLAYANKNDFEHAEESWNKAIQLNSKWTDARLNLGALQIRQLRWRDAEKNLKEAAKDLAYQNQHQVFFNLALVYFEWQKPLAAEQQLKLAVQNSPNFCEAWYRLGNSQKTRGDVDAAVYSLGKAVSGTCFRAYPEAHLEISNLYLRQHKAAKAKAKLVEVIQLFPDSDWARKAELSLNEIH